MRRTLLAACLAVKASDLHCHIHGRVRDHLSPEMPSQRGAPIAGSVIEDAGRRSPAGGERGQ
eukprot:8495144-Heterocapsa_arctica.AAC.1